MKLLSGLEGEKDTWGNSMWKFERDDGTLLIVQGREVSQPGPVSIPDLRGRVELLMCAFRSLADEVRVLATQISTAVLK